MPIAELKQLILDLKSLNQSDQSLEALMATESGTLKESLIETLVSLNRQQITLFDQPLSISEYIEQVVEQVEATLSQTEFELDNDKRSILIQLLQAALLPERGLGFILKISDLRTHHHKNFSRIQIVSDIRPVFPSDELVSMPHAALITHSLKLTYQEQSGDFQDIFVGLDTEELYEIRKSIERAIEKAKMLDEFLSGAGFVTAVSGLEA